MSEPPVPPPRPECIQVVFCDDFRERLETWLAAHGWVIALLPAEYQHADDLATYIIVPADDAVERARRERARRREQGGT